MSSSYRVRKQNSEKNQQVLKQLLKEEGNKTCSDCKLSNHPRWASWNLGCFICIRCSGIHRSMGTHISRVKSVDLDTWTDEQVESMVKWGNNKSNWYWEAKLPDGYVPDQSKIENFIRTKYDMKKWVGSANVPDPLSITSSGKNGGSSQQTVSNKSAPPLISTSHVNGDRDSPRAQIQQQQQQQQQKARLQSSSSEFSDFKSATSNFKTSSLPSLPIEDTSSPIQSSSASTIPIIPSNNPTTTNTRPDLKKSILSLYSKPLVPSPSTNLYGNLAAPTNNAHVGQFATTNNTGSNTYGNQWNATTVSQVKTASVSNNGLDDELFKNVWG